MKIQCAFCGLDPMNEGLKDGRPTQRRIAGASFFWNAAYAGLNALQAAVLLFAISRTHDLPTVGMVTIGFAIANLVSIVARYGMRNYQVTDSKEVFRFFDYFLCRVSTAGIAFVLSALYLLYMVWSGRYTPVKSLIVLEIIGLKLTEAVEDVFVGRLQQRGRLDIGARIAAFRLATSTTVVFGALWWIRSLPVCFLLGIAAEILVDAILVPAARKYADFRLSSPGFGNAGRLLRVGIPLCVGMALHNYVGNAPKYLVDLYLTDELQAVCGYVMMPMFVLAILNTFVMQPAVKGLGDAWHMDPALFVGKAVRHISLILVLAAVVLCAGLAIGIPLLSLLYKVDLLPYRKEFLILMAGGGLFTVSSYMIVLLTAMRRQTAIVWGCLAAILVYGVFGRWASQKAELPRTCALYIVANAAMVAVYLAVLIKGIGNSNKTRERSC